MSKILITGGAGFIGLHLARALLAAGHCVDLLDNFSRAKHDPELDAVLASPGCRLFEADLAGAVPTLDTDYDTIFHFAAIVGVRHVLERPYDVLNLNTKLLANAIDLGRQQRVLGRFVFTSTSEIYAGTLRHFDIAVPTPETTPLTIPAVEEPRTSYMLSKIYGEAMCHHSGLPYTIVRPHNVYGPRMGMAHVVPELLQRAYTARDGDHLDIHSPGHKRVFCYVDDAVDLLVRIVNNDACQGKTLNLGSTNPEISIEELADIILDVVGRKLTIEPLADTAGSPTRRAPDMTLAQQLTGYESSVDTREGVARTFDWYRKNVFDTQGVSAT